MAQLTCQNHRCYLYNKWHEKQVDQHISLVLESILNEYIEHTYNKEHKLTFELHQVLIYYHHIIHDNELVDLFPKQSNKHQHMIYCNQSDCLTNAP